MTESIQWERSDTGGYRGYRSNVMEPGRRLVATVQRAEGHPRGPWVVRIVAYNRLVHIGSKSTLKAAKSLAAEGWL